ncbi:MAG: phospholipase A [Chitinophagaceae bacterium]
MRKSLGVLLILISFFSAVRGQDNKSIILPSSFQTMDERWELSPETRKSSFRITAYKPVYVTAGRYSNNPNTRPVSENPAYSLPFRINYNNYEAKFQLSLKAKMAQGLFAGHGDLWIAYTQKAHWQIYNEKLSRPFRELNYEPEVILNFATKFPLLGFMGRMVGVSFVHQSNGRTLPLSRSWNRLIFHAGFERKNWQVIFRPWIRLKDAEDENPAISNYIGRGELIVVRNFKKHQLSLQTSHSLRTGNNSHGSLLASWVLVLHKNIKAQFQVADGYGETLMDYNHKQVTYGISLSLIEW